MKQAVLSLISLGISPGDIQNKLGPLAERSRCADCRQMIQGRIRDVLVRWVAVAVRATSLFSHCGYS